MATELDRIDLTTPKAFARWLAVWKARWLAGDRIRVEVARDGSHARVVRDPYARRPVDPLGVQLTLWD